jgi:AcrR family transcriptional regulator
MTESSRARLLAAAERLIIDEGLKALSIRRIAAETGLNSALIRYYFGSVDGLLTTLAQHNLEPMLGQWAEAPGAEAGLAAVLRGYFAPMWAPARHCPDERALVLIDEIVAHGEPAVRDVVAPPLLVPFERTLGGLAVLRPDLYTGEAAARLSFASAGALGMPPRSHARRLFAGRAAFGRLDDALRFAMALFAGD